MTPILSCPNCGASLVVYVGSPGEAPFLCRPCAHSWHPSELDADARRLWDSGVKCHRRDAGLRARVEADIASARGDGVNVPAAHAARLTESQRARIARRLTISDAMRTAIGGSR